ARVGLPEIKVGLFPGAGGTQRVARVMPTPDALQMLLKGDQIRPAAAKKMALIHEAPPADQIVALATAWVKANPNAKAPWDDPKFKLPSGKVYSAQGMMIWPPANAPPTNLRKVGVLGAGLMGAGIAYVSASAGLDVVLIDRDQESADKGKAYSDKLISSQIAKGRAKTADKEALLSRITPTVDYTALKGCDLIIEAVFEDRAVKEEATKKAQAVVGPDVVFASNTSTLPISSLAGTSLDPEHFIGVHFFSPVEKMMLTEIIMGEKTGPKALATAMDFVRAIKKTPIVVNDCRGFYVNRCVGNYMVEAHAMVMEGVPAPMIENAAKMAGMPVGPLALNDEVGIDLSLRILQAAKADLGANAINPAQEKLIEAMAAKEGRFGRKNGKGFYDYPTNGPKSLWPGLAKIVGKRLDAHNVSVKDLKDRFLFPVALEAARCMDEGIVTDPREADVGSILGFGYAPYSGGAVSFIDGMGLKAFVSRAKELAAKYGPQFEPGEKLVRMAERGETFYGSYSEKRKAA